MSSYVYIESENWLDDDGIRRHLYTVGFYKPNGQFEPESDHDNKGDAAERVAWLNGGIPPALIERFETACTALEYMEGRA